MRLSFCVTLIFLLVVTTLVHADKAPGQPSKYWPAWRGPTGSGSTTKGKYAVEFDATKGHAWKLALPGKGCSTPIVYGDCIYLTTPIGDEDSPDDGILALDWNGKEQWRQTIGDARKGKHRNGSASNPSPVTDGKGIYVYYKSGNAAGLTMEGKVKWSHNLQKKYGKDTLYWDLGTSPVLTKKHVIYAVMHGGPSYLVAFDKETGEVAWKVDRTYKTPVENDHSYATPHVIEVDGKERILVWGAERVTCHEAESGKMIWSCAGFNPQNKRNWVAVGSSVLAGDDMLVVPYGRNKHIAGIRLGGKGDVTETHRVWTRDNAGSFVPTPVYYKGHIYVVRDRGEVICLNPKNGETIWQAQLPKHRASYYASPTIADDKLYATREDGVIFVADIKSELKLLSENNMGERVIGSPVPVANRLLIRGEKHLFSVGKADLN